MQLFHIPAPTHTTALNYHVERHATERGEDPEAVCMRVCARDGNKERERTRAKERERTLRERKRKREIKRERERERERKRLTSQKRSL